MLFELRTYDFAPGKALDYLTLFGREGLPLITRHLPLAGYWMTEIGALNRLRHLWIYQDFADRTARRERLLADKDWMIGFLPKGLSRIERQASQLMKARPASQQLDEFAASADRTHESVAVDTPLLKSGFASLLSAASPAIVIKEPVLQFSVIAGAGTGSQIALIEGYREDVVADASDFEILRSASFSPL
jgi:hypothetical protein